MRARSVALGGLLALSVLGTGRVLNLRARSGGPLRPPFAAKGRDWAWEEQRVRVWEAGEGPPAVLLHGVYAGASAYEWRHVAPALGARFRVIAPDLPGFGASERPARRYSAALYVRFIEDLVRGQAGRPVLLVASGLSGALALVAASREPELVDRVVLSCPTGVEALASPAGPLRQAVHTLLRQPGVGDTATVLLGRRRTVTKYLRDYTYFDDSRLEPEAVQVLHDQTLQPGARFALAAFISGALDVDVREPLRTLRTPLDIAWGRQAEFTPYEQSRAFLLVQPAARLHTFERCGNAPHLEQPERFLELFA